jgi:hypothetical protein
MSASEQNASSPEAATAVQSLPGGTEFAFTQHHASVLHAIGIHPESLDPSLDSLAASDRSTIESSCEDESRCEDASMRVVTDASFTRPARA